jgi:hypothetical protein
MPPSRERSAPREAVPPGPMAVLGAGLRGYNFMVAPNWLIGVEGELDASAAQGTVVIPNMVAAATITSNHRWYGTLEGRLGYPSRRSCIGDFRFENADCLAKQGNRSCLAHAKASSGFFGR